MRINIIIPNYNKEPFVIKCLESCLNQTYENLGVIFIDNDSTDNSLQLVKDFSKTHDRDFIIDVAENIYPRCWEECIEKAEQYLDGEYYTIVGSDDYLDENYIANFCEWIKEQEEEVLAVHSDLLWVEDGKDFNYTTYKYSDIDDLKLKLVQGCAINSPTVFYSRKITEDKSLKAKPEVYSGAADYDFYCQLVDKGIFIHNIGDWIGYHYNVNKSQATWEMHLDPINYTNVIIKKYKDKWKI
tara:strand:- start:169 stop:894 length:726 start_codon:yes stop_codon:yes gene_type:complete